jgi:hypothetical protein
MIGINENYLKLRAGYLFPEIGRCVRERGGIRYIFTNCRHVRARRQLTGLDSNRRIQHGTIRTRWFSGSGW